jgi:tetratricopeptide (TPR) repeat protein
LRRFRLAAGLTQEELAEQARLSARAITDLERGVRRAPRRETVALLVAALNLGARDRAALEAAARGRSTSGATPMVRPSGGDGAPVASPFVGRGQEQVMIAHHMAGSGPPVLLLAGEPGIGKSRLLHEAALRATDAGLHVLRGGCQRRGGQEPYSPLLEALERHIRQQSPAQLRHDLKGCLWLVHLLPELTAGLMEPPPWTLPPAQLRRLMFNAVERFLANTAGPAGTLLLLDDLQWAGTDALDLLAWLVRSADLPVRVLGAYRDTETVTHDPLTKALADLAQAGLAGHHLLAPLGEEEVSELLATLLEGIEGDRAALAAGVARRAGGVPFLLVSCAQALRRDGSAAGAVAIPWDAAQAIRQRVAALSAEAQEVLSAAALIGRVVSPALLTTVARRPESTVWAALDAAHQARLLIDADEGYQFTHDLIREVVEADLGRGRRLVVHRHIAEALEQLVGDLPVDLLAYHYERCGDQDKVVLYLERAGDQAQAQAAYAAAEKRYRELLERLDQSGRTLDGVRVREKLAGVLATDARYDAALALLEEAAASLHAGDLEGMGRIAARMGHIHYDRGTLEEGVACLRPVLDRLEVRGPSSALALVYCALAELNLNWGHWAQEVAAAEQAGHVARLVGDTGSLARAECLRGEALGLMGREEEGLPVLSEALRLAEAVGARECLCEALSTMAWFYKDRGEFQQSLRHAERALLEAERLGNPVLTAGVIGQLGEVAFYRGEWDRAREYYTRTAAIHHQICLAPQSCDAGGLLLLLGQLSLQAGGWEQAYRYLEECRIIFTPQGKLSGLRTAQSLLAEHDIQAGRPAAACARLVPLLDRWGAEELDVTTAVLPMLAWASLELGDFDRAARVIADATGRARAGTYRLSLVDGLRVQALVALRQGQWTEVEGCLEEGLALARALPYPHGEGRLLEVCGRLHLDRGERAAARDRLAAALAIFRRLGARKDIEQTEQLLAAHLHPHE